MLRPICLTLALLPAPALAHPHIFIDTGVEVIYEAGLPAAVRITWSYDDFYSMIMIEDRQLDRDNDGLLTETEQAVLSGFDMDWDPDFVGDTYVLAGERPIPLSRPSDWTARYTDGRITSTHVRRLQEPFPPGAELVVQTYDPGYYTAYTIAWAQVLNGADPACTTQVLAPDPAQADAILQAALDELAGGNDVEMDFPAVGHAYAEEVRVACPAR